MRTNTARKTDENGDSSPNSAHKIGHGEKLTRSMRSAIVALLAHPTIPQAAKACGISETTLWRWLQRDDFREQYKDAQHRVFDGALGLLQGAATEAVTCLRRNLTCKNASAEVQAARTILHLSLRVQEVFNLETRIQHMESALAAREEAEKNGTSEMD